MTDATMTRVQSKSKAADKSKTTVATEIDKVIIGSVAAFTGVVGLWSLACIGVAMFQAGGPLQLVGGWFRAVSGM